jgi:hypothetical protein
MRAVTPGTVNGPGHFLSDQQPERLAGVIWKSPDTGDPPRPAARPF